MSVETFTLPSFAKLNWTLRVLGRREDGFHELRTIFQTVTLHDQISFTARDDAQLKLTCDAPDVPDLPLDERNLILRAARALREQSGSQRGASIHLEKVIPAEGGLGGGSSNAAVTLLGLAHLWNIETNKRQLEKIAASLGADVPFFLTGGTALGIGLGTEVKPIEEVDAGHLLIVKPEAKVSTAEAYKSLNASALTKVGSDIILSISRADERFADSYPSGLHNDFEPVVFQQQPEIARARNALLTVGARAALLAGSGSSVFGVFDNQTAQAGAVDALREEQGWRLFPCATISRAEYLAVLGDCAAPLRAS